MAIINMTATLKSQLRSPLALTPHHQHAFSRPDPPHYGHHRLQIRKRSYGPCIQHRPCLIRHVYPRSNVHPRPAQSPSGSSGDASLWVGMGTLNGDLVQSIASNWQSDDWNVYVYILLSTGG